MKGDEDANGKSLYILRGFVSTAETKDGRLYLLQFLSAWSSGMWHVRTLSRGQKPDLESHQICLIAKAKKEILENTKCPSMHDLASIHYYRLLSSFSAGRVAFVKLAERNIFVKAMHTVVRRLNLLLLGPALVLVRHGHGRTAVSVADKWQAWPTWSLPLVGQCFCHISAVSIRFGT